MIIYHPTAGYSGWFAVPTNRHFDSRDGMGWIIDGAAEGTIIPRLDANCEDCPQAYDAGSRPGGHVAARQIRRQAASPGSARFKRDEIRKLRTLLHRLSYSAYGELPGQNNGLSMPWGTVTKWDSALNSVLAAPNDDWIQCTLPDGRDARSIPIHPEMVCYFDGGTAFDHVIRPRVLQVNYLGGGPSFQVKINWNIGNRVFYGMVDAGTARLVFCDFSLPQSETMFAHEQLSVKRHTVTFGPGDLDGNGAFVLPNHSGLFAGWRPAAPVRAEDCVFGAGTFRLRFLIGGAWVDWTDSIYDGGWARLQITHSAYADFQTRVYLRGLVPAADGSLIVSSDLLAIAGASQIELRYYAEYPVGFPGQKRLTSPLCGNCRRDYSNLIGNSNSGATGVGVGADGRHWFCHQRGPLRLTVPGRAALARFVPGRCSQARSCPLFYYGKAQPHTDRLLAELDTGIWLVQSQTGTAPWFPETIYYWFCGNGIQTLLGDYCNVPGGFFPQRGAEMNGILGWYLEGSIEDNDIRAWCGGRYLVKKIDWTESSDPQWITAANINDRKPGLLPQNNITGPTATIKPGQQALVAPENDSSDPWKDVRDDFIRVTPGRTLYPTSENQWNGSARDADNGLEGETRCMRPTPSTLTRTYFPAFSIVGALSHEGPHGAVTPGAWTFGGTVYGLRIQRATLGPALSYKILQGATGPTTWGTVKTVSVSMSAIVSLDIAPGLYSVGHSIGGGDEVIEFLGSGNAVRIPDYARIRNYYDGPYSQVAHGAFERARAGDVIEFNATDCPSLAGRRYWLATAKACGGSATGEWMPVGMGISFGVGDISHLGFCDRLDVVDENDDLLEAIAANELIEGARFRISSGLGGYSWTGEFEVGLGERGTVLPAIPALHVRAERASGRAYVTAAWLTGFDNAELHCAWMRGQLTGRLV